MSQKKIWLCPIAGNGTRTKKLGDFKPFIDVSGKKVIEWFLLSVKNNVTVNDEFIFVTTQHFDDMFGVRTELSKLFKKNGFENSVKIRVVDYTPQGPARSVELGLSLIMDREVPVVVINVDQFLLFKLPNLQRAKCYLVANIDLGSSKSYIGLIDNKVSRLVEKENISNIASTGVYIFPNLGVLEESLEYLFENNVTCNNEYYIANALNSLIGKVDFELIASIAKLDLGTVENIQYFERLTELFGGLD